MKLTLISALALMLVAQISWAQIPQNMSYQGLLTDGSGTAVSDGAYSLSFSIYDVDTGGIALWTETHASVAVVNGIFNVILGSVNPLNIAFDTQYWLGVQIDGGAELTPRIQLNSSPYSLNTRTIVDGAVTTDKIADDAVTGGKIADGHVVRSVNGKTDAVVLASGTNITIEEGGNTLTINSSSWGLTGNAGTSPPANFLGTTDDNPLAFHVFGARVLLLKPHSTSPNIIGGYSDNWITDGVYGAAIGGGGTSLGKNRVSDSYGTVSGGQGNQAGDGDNLTENAKGATVGGGNSNMASATASTVSGGNDNDAGGDYATVGGGLWNEANGSYSTVGGGELNEATGGFGTVAGGNRNEATGSTTTVAGGNRNVASGISATVPGGLENTAVGSYSFAAGRQAKALHDGCFVWNDSTGVDHESTDVDQFVVRASGGVRMSSGIGILRLQPGGDVPNVIAGHIGNGVTSGVGGATISGGGEPAPSWANSNRVTDNYGTVGGGSNNDAGNSNMIPTDTTHATVGGGRSNTASGSYSTIGGGLSNTASGGVTAIGGGDSNVASGYSATVSGGYGNTANGSFSTVGGGVDNTASGENATAGGGQGNLASGNCSVVPGGCFSSASADYSFAAGSQANANHIGSFVWGDGSTDAPVTSTRDHQFLVRAAGGTWLYSNPELTSGVRLSGGSSALATVSDRAMKRNIRQVDGKDILSRLSEIPIGRWSYKAQDPEIEHIGPMAQDFYAAFGLGEDDRHISTIDPDGVALAAIQGLYELVQEKDAQIAELEARLAMLEASVLPRDR